MEWKIKREVMEFNSITAQEGDLYLYHNNTLIYVGNSIQKTYKKSFWERLKSLFRIRVYFKIKYR